MNITDIIKNKGLLFNNTNVNIIIYNTHLQLRITLFLITATLLFPVITSIKMWFRREQNQNPVSVGFLHGERLQPISKHRQHENKYQLILTSCL